jgi:hypothetical protein
MPIATLLPRCRLLDVTARPRRGDTLGVRGADSAGCGTGASGIAARTGAGFETLVVGASATTGVWAAGGLAGVSGIGAMAVAVGIADGGDAVGTAVVARDNGPGRWNVARSPGPTGTIITASDTVFVVASRPRSKVTVCLAASTVPFTDAGMQLYLGALLMSPFDVGGKLTSDASMGHALRARLGKGEPGSVRVRRPTRCSAGMS